MDQQNPFLARPVNFDDLQARRHAAQIESGDIPDFAYEENPFLADEVAEDGFDGGPDYTEDDLSEDTGPSSLDAFELVRRHAIPWLMGILSPPFTGPVFGLSARLIQWQHEKDSSDDDES